MREVLGNWRVEESLCLFLVRFSYLSVMIEDLKKVS